MINTRRTRLAVEPLEGRSMPNAFGLESLFAPLSIFDAKRTKKRSPDEASAMIAPLTAESAPVSVAATTTPWIGWADMTRRQSDLMSRMAVDSTGRPVMVGNSNGSIALSRHAPNATLDTSFDGDGKVFVVAPSGKQTVSGASGDIVIQPDGQVVVGGRLSTSSSPAGDQFFLARLNANGSLDTSFDGDGKVATPMPAGVGGSQVHALALDVSNPSQVKIVAAGNNASSSLQYTSPNPTDWVIARYLPNGRLDDSFGDDGIVTVDPMDGLKDVCWGVAVQADGRVVVGGYSTTNTSGVGADPDRYLTLARLNADGSLDTSFDGDGMASFRSPSSSWDQMYDLAIDRQGRIIAVGMDQVGTSGADSHTLVVRFNGNGSLDTTFDGDGSRVIPVSPAGRDYAQAVALQDMGSGQPQKIVLGGRAWEPNVSGQDFSVIRLNDDGSLDTTFGGTGVVRHNVNQGDDSARDIAVVGTGEGARIYAGGMAFSTVSGTYDYVVVRYRSDGVVDAV